MSHIYINEYSHEWFILRYFLLVEWIFLQILQFISEIFFQLVHWYLDYLIVFCALPLLFLDVINTYTTYQQSSPYTSNIGLTNLVFLPLCDQYNYANNTLKGLNILAILL